MAGLRIADQSFNLPLSLQQRAVEYQTTGIVSRHGGSASRKSNVGMTAAYL
jgi:hypothetical protein